MRASSAAAQGVPCGSWVGNALLLQPVRFDRATELTRISGQGNVDGGVDS